MKINITDVNFNLFKKKNGILNYKENENNLRKNQDNNLKFRFGNMEKMGETVIYDIIHFSV